jgi:hypothetical protein
MQRFHATTHDFREASVFGDFGNRNEIFYQQPGCTARGEYIYAFLMQGLGKFQDTGFIGNTDERTSHGAIVWIEHDYFAVLLLLNWEAAHYTGNGITRAERINDEGRIINNVIYKTTIWSGIGSFFLHE